MPEEKKNTEQAGAVPADKGKEAGTPTGAAEEKSDPSTEEKLPFDQHPKWKEARTAAKKLNDLLKANGLESVEDLADLIDSGKKVKGKQVDLDRLDEIAAKAAKLDQYEAYWRDQEERKRRDEEDPSERAERLEKMLKEKERQERHKEELQRQAAKAQEAINAYERDVTGQVKDMDIPKEQQGFVLKFFGVGNEANDIDITDRKAVKRIIEKGIKEKEAYDQAVIKAYLEGKGKVPTVTTTTPAAPQEAKQKIMLKDARSIFKDMMQKASGG